MRALSTLCLAAGLAAGLTFTAAASAAEQASADRASASRLDQRVRRLENVLDSGQLVDLMRRLDALTNEIRQLRGAVETQGHRIDELQERQRRLYGDLDRRLRDLEVAGRQQQPQAPDGSGSRPSPDTGEGAPADAGGDAPGAAADQLQGDATGAERAEAEDGDAGAATDGASEAQQREAYNGAFELLKDGRYEAASTAFSDFLEQHPQGPYSDNAQYWLGETRYVRRDFEGALEAFQRTVQRYPDSAKLPDARLKIGYTLHELQRYDEARAVLKDVIAEHSGNTVARLAEERLLRLERQQGN